MDGLEYQALALRTVNTNVVGYDRLRNAAYGLNGEAGEFIDILKKHEFQGHELNYVKLIDELGDILWYAAIACNAMGVTLDEVMRKNIEKLRNRYPEGFDAEKSIHRKE